MITRKRKKGAGRKAKHPPKFPEQQKKMEEVVAYFSQKGWTQERLAVDMFGIASTTFSSWCTGQVKLSARTKNTFAYKLNINPLFWTDPTMTIEEAIHSQQQVLPPPRLPAELLGEFQDLLNQAQATITKWKDFLEQGPPTAPPAKRGKNPTRAPFL